MSTHTYTTVHYAQCGTYSGARCTCEELYDEFHGAEDTPDVAPDYGCPPTPRD